MYLASICDVLVVILVPLLCWFCSNCVFVSMQVSIRWLWQPDSADNGRPGRECRAPCSH